MRVGLDANISPKVTKALNALYPDHDFVPVGIGPATSDAPWISEFASKGGDGYLGMDKQILNKPHEVSALEGSGLSTCLFDFGKLKGLAPQAAVMIYAWPKIAQAWSTLGSGAVLRTRPSINLASFQLERLEFWLDNGQPRLRKAAVHRP